MLKSIVDQPKVGIISPAWAPDKQRLTKGITYLKAHGLTVITPANCCNKRGLFAGTEQQRLDDLHTVFADQNISTIFCSRGGWGTLKLLDKIDYKLIEKNAKLIVGYSDITTLQLAIWHKTKIPSLSGPMVAVEMGEEMTLFTEKHLWGQLENQSREYRYHLENLSLINKERKKTSVSGILIGGCLSLVVALLGTPYCPDFKGSILFLEDIGEQPHKIDRALAQLYQAGVFKCINGLILGNFVDCIASYKGRARYTLKEIFNSYFQDVSFPVLTNFPYGHGRKIFSLPIGIQATIDLAHKEIRIKNPYLQR
jgi:muramoyltetrapeptide carboxypeptidase